MPRRLAGASASPAAASHGVGPDLPGIDSRDGSWSAHSMGCGSAVDIITPGRAHCLTCSTGRILGCNGRLCGHHQSPSRGTHTAAHRPTLHFMVCSVADWQWHARCSSLTAVVVSPHHMHYSSYTPLCISAQRLRYATPSGYRYYHCNTWCCSYYAQHS